MDIHPKARTTPAICAEIQSSNLVVNREFINDKASHALVWHAVYHDVGVPI